MKGFNDEEQEVENFRKTVEFVESSCNEDSRLFQGQYFYYL